MNSRTLFHVELLKCDRLHARLSPEGGVSRLIALVVLGTLLTGCQKAGPPLPPTPEGSEYGEQIAFHSTRDGDEEIFIMNADGTGVTQLTFNTNIFDAVPTWTARRPR